MKVGGYLYERQSSGRVEASLSLHDNTYRLSAYGDEQERDVEIVSASPFINGIPQQLVISTGQTFAPFEELPDGFLNQKKNKYWRVVSALEKFSIRNVIICVLLFVIAIFSIRAGLPIIADAASALVPKSVEAVVGRTAFEQFESLLLKESKLSSARQESLASDTAKLARENGFQELPELHFRDAPTIGANAFAFPGGPIVITDQLVEVVASDEGVLAVIAHELGHFEGRHGLRQILRAAGLLVVASTILGADEVILDELSAFALSLAASGYSRGFESEADEFAVRMLVAGGYSPQGLIHALDALANRCGKPCSEGGWFSTHPGHGERINALKAFSE